MDWRPAYHDDMTGDYGKRYVDVRKMPKGRVLLGSPIVEVTLADHKDLFERWKSSLPSKVEATSEADILICVGGFSNPFF